MINLVTYSNHKIPLTSVTEYYYIKLDEFSLLQNMTNIYTIKDMLCSRLKYCTKDSALKTIQSKNEEYIIFIAGRSNGRDIYMPIKRIIN